ncbi:MAG TPA: cytochrome c oxidase subunit 3 [Flavobacterium sp.]|nr:cytochrome c oxidase subunit 3 [Flavobacterium sp.]
MENQSVFNTYQNKSRTYKTMLWIGMISMFMMFGGLTSAYIVSKSRPDWMSDFELPFVFSLSTFVIITSSIIFHLAVKAIKRDNRAQTSLFLGITLILGIIFIVLQFVGFNEIIETGYFFTGPESSVTTSFLYIVVVMHLAHLFAGIISLLIVIYNHYKQKYNSSQPLGIELSALFWHFLDFVWLYLFLFLYFFK